MTHALADLGPRIDTTLPTSGAATSPGPSTSGAAFAEAVDAAVGQAQRESRREGDRSETTSRADRGADRDQQAGGVRDDGARREDEPGRVHDRGHRDERDREQSARRGSHGSKEDASPLLWTVVPHALATVTGTSAGHRHTTASGQHPGGADRIADSTGSGSVTLTGAAADGLRNAATLPAQRGTQFHFTHDARLGTPAGLADAGAKAQPGTSTTDARPGRANPAEDAARTAPHRDSRSDTAVPAAAKPGSSSAAAAATGAVPADPGPKAAPSVSGAPVAAAAKPAVATGSAQAPAVTATATGTAATTASSATTAPPAAALPTARTFEHVERHATAKAPAATSATTADPGPATVAPSATSTAAQAVSPAAVHVPTVTGSTVNSAPVTTATPVPTPTVPLAQPDVANILAQLRGATDGTYQLRARVHPAELGAVSITATVQGGTLHVLLSPDQTAQQAISQSLPQLRAHLADQGFTGVDVGLGSPQQSPGQSGQGERGEHGAHTQGSDHTVGTGRENVIDSVEGASRTSRHRANTSSALDRML